MNRNLDPKKESALEEALKLKDEGKRLPYIIAKFPDYESEIREIFGIVAFIRENDNKVSAPKNILKTLLSKMTDNSSNPSFQPKTHFKKEIVRENNFYIPTEEETEKEEVGDEVPDQGSNLYFGKWKIIMPVAILAIVMAVILLRSGPIKDVEVINENMEASLNSSDLIPTSNFSEIASSTESDDN